MGKRALGIAIWLVLALAIWTGSPAVAVALNVFFRPDYRMRDFSTEYLARLRPNRVHWYDFKAYRMQCAGEGERRVVVLHTIEFDESPTDFISRSFPHCSGFKQERDGLPPGVSGLAVGRY